MAPSRVAHSRGSVYDLGAAHPLTATAQQFEWGIEAALNLLFAPAAAIVAFLAHLLVLVGECLQFIVRQMFDVDHLVVGLINRLDDFRPVLSEWPGRRVLGILDQEHDKESDYLRPSIDDELPGIGVVEVRFCEQP
jgi:hypothetical protein